MRYNFLVKKNTYNKLNGFTLVMFFVGLITLLGGVSYAFFNYSRVSNTMSQLITGEVYMHYNEGIDTISLERAFPENDEVAREKKDNYITFTIDGKNTTTNNDIYYEIKLIHGEDIEDKTRLKDENLKFDLIEIINNESNIVLSGISYDEINDTRIYVNTIKRNTIEEVEITYQLRMWISDDTLISDTAPNADYTTSVYKNSYATIKVLVYGDFEEKDTDSLYSFLDSRLASNLVIDSDNAKTVSGSNELLINNYVWYSGKLWRVVSLNEDGSVKLMTDENISTIHYGSGGTYQTSWIKQWLNEDFLDTLYNYENIVVTNYNWNISSTSSEEVVTTSAPVGLLHINEYKQSYDELIGSGNSFLNNGYYWWSTEVNSSLAWMITNSGYTSSGYAGYGVKTPSDCLHGVRPAIVLKPNIKILGGNGTKNNPYTLAGDINQPKSNDLLNGRVSGEYLKFDNELYRIVDTFNNVTKITKVDYLRDENNEVINKKLSSSAMYGASGNIQNDEYWDYYLNNSWYNNISKAYKSMIINESWYLGVVNRSSYKNSICSVQNTSDSVKNCLKTENKFVGKIGLGRIGEMFTSQIAGGYTNSSNMWILTPIRSEDVWYIQYTGDHSDYFFGEANESVNAATALLAVRPSMYLNSNIKIVGGYGTLNNPFEISL